MKLHLHAAIAILCGVLVSAGTFLLSTSPAVAPGTAVVYTLAVGLFVRANDALVDRTHEGERRPGMIWTAASAVLPLVGSRTIFWITGSSALREELAVLTLVLGVALGSLAAGIGLALGEVDGDQ